VTPASPQPEHPASPVAPESQAPPFDLRSLRAAVERHLDDYLRDLRSMVNVDCGTYLPDGVNLIADMMQERLRAAGWSVERRAHHPAAGEDRYGDALVARIAGSRPVAEGGRRILLVGHMDTVFPAGTAAERPYRTEGSRAFGPGVSDMKGGLLAGLYAVTALRDAGLTGFDSVTYVCNPDEEVGSPFSTPIIREMAASADVCFVLEGARENGDIVSARKGTTDVKVIVHGRAAHAGVEPERGRSAILQAAHATIALTALTGRWPGVTVNVGRIDGGIRPNVIPDRCELQVDVRAPTAELMRTAIDAVERAASEIHVPDTTVEVHHEPGFPPMERTEAIERLVHRAREIAAGLGFEARDAATGGASDANNVAGMGVPVLDGLGPVGGADHAPGEWLDLDSVVPRTTLLAGMIASPGA
jgi:glutamate carboxypeptidase